MSEPPRATDYEARAAWIVADKPSLDTLLARMTDWHDELQHLGTLGKPREVQG